MGSAAVTPIRARYAPRASSSRAGPWCTAASVVRARVAGVSDIEIDGGATRLVLAVGDDSGALPGRAVGVLHTIRLVDRVAPLEVVLRYRTWFALDLVEQWVEVTNTGDAPVRLHQAASGAPALGGDAPHLTHWGGGWAGEWQQTTERLTQGTKTVASFGGVRPSLYRPPVVLWTPDGAATETEGSVLAGTVRWAATSASTPRCRRTGSSASSPDPSTWAPSGCSSRASDT